jgi:Domain of unknown function (DUF1707)
MRLAADAQRERTVLTLRRAYLDGRLHSEEFAERAGLALSARTTRELRALVRDVPHLAEPAKALAVTAAKLVLLASLWLARLAIVLLVAMVRLAVRTAVRAPARLHGRT